MQLPSREQITGRRVDRIKGLISDTLETQELGFFEALIDGFQSEHNIGMSEIAAALAYLVQKERPLQIEERESRKPRQERGEPSQKAERPERRPKKPREGKQEEIPMDNYRVEVGKEHGVEPKHLVGAIANEAGIESQYIGHIKLFDTHSTIDLPEGMPKDIYKHLKRVWVCGRQLNISLLGEPQKSRKPKSFKPNSSKPKKPIARKPKKQKARKKRAE
jgi:ATP-dependent RNA helicase DeaD